MSDDKKYINPRPEEEVADDLLREVVGDDANDEKRKQSVTDQKGIQFCRKNQLH